MAGLLVSVRVNRVSRISVRVSVRGVARFQG